MKTPRKLTRRIIGSIILGVIVGYVCHHEVTDGATLKTITSYLSLVTDIFLRMIRMIIAPLVLATIVSGIASTDDTKAIGRIAVKAVAWFIAASLISLSIGLLFVNMMHPGSDMNLQLSGTATVADLKGNELNVRTFVTSTVPNSIVDAMSRNDIIQILVFSLFFGLALSKITDEYGRVLRQAIDGLMNVMFRITNMVMLFAPLGIFAALAASIAIHGLSVLVTYGKFIGSFYLALASLWVVLCLLGYAVLGRRIFRLVKLVFEPVMMAFATASSEAAYPKTLERLQSFGIERRLVGLVLPLGYSFNLDGSMVYQAFASIFIAQAFHIHMTLNQQVAMLLVLMVSSKGMAAVPRGSLVVVAAILPMFGLPEAGLLLVIGIDQFLDMGRTATNVLGNSIASAVIAKWENQLGPEVSRGATSQWKEGIAEG